MTKAEDYYERYDEQPQKIDAHEPAATLLPTQMNSSLWRDIVISDNGIKYYPKTTASQAVVEEALLRDYPEPEWRWKLFGKEGTEEFVVAVYKTWKSKYDSDDESEEESDDEEESEYEKEKRRITAKIIALKALAGTP
jgi:hypothetical protein